MTLRQRLKEAEPMEAMEIIQNLKPLEISPFDMKALLLIRDTRKRDCLAYLGLEAKWWIQDNLPILKKRFSRREHEKEKKDSG